MREIYIVEYQYETGHKINSDGWEDLEECRKWCARNGATPNHNQMTYHWIENGDSYYIIHPITVKKEKNGR